MTDLSLVSSDNLAKELLRRCTAGAIVYVQEGAQGRGRDFFYHNFVGDALKIIGLCTLVVRTAQNQMIDQCKLQDSPDGG